MKRRRKPWYRLRNVVFVLATLVALAIGREVYTAVTATPGQRENYPQRIAELIERGQPKDVPADSLNAVDIVEKAIVLETAVQADYRAKVSLPGGQVPIDYSLLRGPMSTKPYGPVVFEQIKTNSKQAMQDLRATEFYALLEQAAATRRAVRPTAQSGPVVGFLLPSLGKYRNLARLNGSRMYLAHQAREDEELVKAYEQTLMLGRIAGHGSFLIEYLVAVAIDALAMSELREELVERVPSEPVLVKLLAAMDRQVLPPMTIAIEGERLSVMDTIQWTHTDDGNGSGRLILTKAAELGSMWGSTPQLGLMGEWKILNMMGVAFPSKAANIRKVDEFFGIVKGAIESPFNQRSPAAIDAMVDQLPERYTLLRMILPAWGKAVQTHDQWRATWDGTRVMLAIEIYRARHGNYPASLGDLAPAVLPMVPMDHYSGKPFGYRRLNPGESRGYLLYTVGPDGMDNGGVQPKSRHDAFSAQRGRGFDYVLNEPRELPEPDKPEATDAPSAPPEPGTVAPDGGQPPQPSTPTPSQTPEPAMR